MTGKSYSMLVRAAIDNTLLFLGKRSEVRRFLSHYS